MFLPPPLSTLFPYTTLFRSFRVSGFQDRRIRPLCHPSAERNYGLLGSVVLRRPRRLAAYIARSARRTVSASDSSFRAVRSEEHTSELQSLRHLVCRLLLEKK